MPEDRTFEAYKRRFDQPERLPYELRIRYLSRFRNVMYPQVADRIESLLSCLDRPAELAVDATGVGNAVVDLLKERGLSFHSVTITGGDAAHSDGRRHRVPKRDLVSGLQVLLQSGRLKIAAGLEHAGTLRSELLNFRVKISESGHDSYSHREGDHDDLLLAACLSAWAANRGRRWSGGGNFGGALDNVRQPLYTFDTEGGDDHVDHDDFIW